MSSLVTTSGTTRDIPVISSGTNYTPVTPRGSSYEVKAAPRKDKSPDK